MVLKENLPAGTVATGDHLNFTDISDSDNEKLVTAQQLLNLYNTLNATITGVKTFDAQVALGGSPDSNTNVVITDSRSVDGTTQGGRTLRIEPVINPLESGVATNGIDYIPTITFVTGADHVSGYQFRPGAATPGAAVTVDRYSGYAINTFTIPTNLTVTNLRGFSINNPTITGTLTNHDGIWTDGISGASGRNNLIYSEGGNVDLIAKDSTFSNQFRCDRYHNTSASAGTNVIFRRSRGTLSSPSAVQSGDRLAFIGSGGHDGTSFGSVSAVIKTEATQNFTASAHGTKIIFETTPDGSTSRAEAVEIDQDGITTLMTTTGAFIPNKLTTTQRNALTGAAGMTIYNTTTNKLNMHNGSAWEAVTSS